MHFLDDKEVCEVADVEDDEEFIDFQSSGAFDLAFIPEPYQNCDGLVMKVDAGNFTKWLHKQQPEIRIYFRKANTQLTLHSTDFWLPLVFLATDITLPIYLNLVATYIYDRTRGALEGETPRVHMDIRRQLTWPVRRQLS